eukprot:GHVS01103584.1.p1 GENE.GHVS01103584.1~~GHVS01103584.1.p1  ORF type:complete len:105 (+),score=26.37 GHVS01103584.1:91-405(+)
MNLKTFTAFGIAVLLGTDNAHGMMAGKEEGQKERPSLLAMVTQGGQQQIKRQKSEIGDWDEEKKQRILEMLQGRGGCKTASSPAVEQPQLQQGMDEGCCTASHS